MKWYVADKDFITYLKGIDSIVPDINYEDSLKPYIGVIFIVNGFNYYLSISSADKPWKVKKYNKMKNSKDFHKLFDSDTVTKTYIGDLIAVLNINNMVPIPDEFVEKLKYDKIDNYRKFDSEEQRNIYIDLLRKELKEITAIKGILESKAKKVYEEKTKYPDSRLSQRCCDFKKLEEAIPLYKKSN